MFWYGEEPWHGLGEQIPEPATLDEALAFGSLDWEVALAPIQTAGSPSNAISQRRAVVRCDVAPGSPGRVLGVVHPRFRPLQNREGASLFHRLLDLGERRYHTGGYLRYGEVVWLLARLPEGIVVDDSDPVETYLLYSNSHDGSQAIDIRLTTVRVVCRNTLSLALHKDAVRPFRLAHRASPAIIEREAKKFFGAAHERIKATEALFRRLARAKCDDADFRRFLVDLLPDPQPPVGAAPDSVVAKAHATRIDTIDATRGAMTRVRREGIRARNLAPDLPTWWGAVNAVTAWTDHLQQVDGDRYAHVMFGTADRMKQKALALAQSRIG